MNDDVALSELVELFALSLGVAKATEIVERAASQLGLRGARLTLAESVSVLGLLATEPGIIGITARLAATRLRRKNTPPSDAAAPADAPPPSSRSRKAVEDAASAAPWLERIVDALSGTLGRQKARDEVEAARAALGLKLPLKHTDCMPLLDRLGEGTGIVSTTARFVKVRFLLNGSKR